MAGRITAAGLNASLQRAESLVAQWPEVRSKAQRRSAARAAFEAGIANVDQILLANPPELEQWRQEMDRAIALWRTIRLAGVETWDAPMWAFTFGPDEELPEELARSLVGEFRAARRPAPPDLVDVCGLNLRSNWAEGALWGAALGDEQLAAYRNRVWQCVYGQWSLNPAIIEASKLDHWASPCQGVNLFAYPNAYIESVLVAEGVPRDATRFELMQAIEQHGPMRGGRTARSVPNRGQK